MKEDDNPFINNYPETLEHPIEIALRQFLRPVIPRHEFVDQLRWKLKQEVLPIQKKKVITFYALFEVFLRTMAIGLLAILTLRAVMIIIGSWKLIRASSGR